jgi:hypothetical protein
MARAPQIDVNDVVDGAHSAASSAIGWLRRNATTLRGYAADALARHLVFFSRSGFSDNLRKAAEIDASVQLIGLDEMVHAPLPQPEETSTPSP